MPEVELGQLFWTNILNVVVQNIELIISARNDELINLFNWLFNGQYTLQFSYGDGKKWFCSDLYIHPYFVSSCLHYRLTLEKKIVFGNCDYSSSVLNIWNSIQNDSCIWVNTSNIQKCIKLNHIIYSEAVKLQIALENMLKIRESP